MNGSKRGLSFFLAAVAVLFVFGVAPIRGDELVKRKELVKAAEGGDAEAQYNLGLRYAEGEACPRTTKRLERRVEGADSSCVVNKFTLLWRMDNNFTMSCKLAVGPHHARSCPLVGRA